jgi:hypothetical protein
MSREPRLKLTYDADGNLSGAECSSCGVAFGKFMSMQISQEWQFLLNSHANPEDRVRS